MRRKGAMMKPAVRLYTGKDEAGAGEQRERRGTAARGTQHPLSRELTPVGLTHGAPDGLVPSVSWAIYTCSTSGKD